MARNNSDDPRFHHEIWTGPMPESKERKSAIYYVENHNGQCSYSELAVDFEIAAMLAIEQFERDRLGNWTAPVAHLVRQTIELMLKSMLSTVKAKGCPPSPALTFSHDLKAIWQYCRHWLKANGYQFEDDARLEQTEWLIEAFHQIDPSGDLFRFGISNNAAFGKQKSCDRVGLRMEVLVPDFRDAVYFLRHWEAVLFRELLAVEMGLSEDPLFDRDDFPRRQVAEK